MHKTCLTDVSDIFPSPEQEKIDKASDKTVQIQDLVLYKTQSDAIRAYNKSLQNDHPLSFNEMINTCCKIREFYANHLQKLKKFRDYGKFIKSTSSTDIFHATNMLLEEMLKEEEKREITYKLIKEKEGNNYLNLFKNWYKNYQKELKKEDAIDELKGFCLDLLPSKPLSLPPIKKT